MEDNQAVVYHITNTIYANKIRLQEEKKVYNILTPCEILMNKISDNPDNMYFTYSMDNLSDMFNEFSKDIIVYPDGSMEELDSDTNLYDVTKKVIRIMADLKHAMVTEKQPNELSQFIFNYNIDRVMGMFNLDSVFGGKYIPVDIYSTIKAVVDKYKWLGSIYKVKVETSGGAVEYSVPETLAKLRDELVKIDRSELIKRIGKYKFYTTGGRILSFTTDKDGKVNIEMKPIIPTEGFSSEF